MLLASGVAYAAIVNCVQGENLCKGTKHNDTVNGSGVRDEMHGFGGNGRLLGNGGNDILFGGKGVDVIRSGEGDDTVDGQTVESDRIYGEGGADNLADNSWRNGVDDDNLLDGGEGDDYLYGQSKLRGGP
jgi:Ca2+-binding RTX toxin-like protein